jgi:hypothetical protein
MMSFSWLHPSAQAGREIKTPDAAINLFNESRLFITMAIFYVDTLSQLKDKVSNNS